VTLDAQAVASPVAAKKVHLLIEMAADSDVVS
jgi:hypothetical protein